MRKQTLKEDILYSFDSENKIYCKCGQYGVVFYNTGRDRLIRPGMVLRLKKRTNK